MKKIIVDILLFIFMLAEFSRVYLPPEIHEIIGICLIVLVIVHLILNGKYIRAIPKGKYNAKRTVMLIVNAGFFISFVLTTVFGVLSSQNVLSFINMGDLTTVYLHKIFAYLSLVLMGLHLGINLGAMIDKIEEKVGKKALYLVFIVIILFGIYSFVDVDFFNHLIGNYGFSMASGNLIANSLEYLSIVLAIAIVANIAFKKIKK